jgi:thiol-disulfide isomerase/thioredoxin
MMDLSKSIKLSEYFQNGTKEDKELQQQIYINTELSSEVKETVKKIILKTSLIAFSENFCPDCRITMSVLKRMQELNSNLEVYVFRRVGNEEIMKNLTGDARIPTIIKYTSEEEFNLMYLEMPSVVKAEMSILDKDGSRKVLGKYRAGQYNKFIEQELLQIIEQ